MNDYLEKMCAHLATVPSQSNGLSTQEAVAQRYEQSDWIELVKQLKADSATGLAAFRFYSFAYERQSDRVPGEIRQQAADAVAEQIKTFTARSCEDLVGIFLAWGNHRSDYKYICQQLLRHPTYHIRMMAVSYAGVFLLPSEYSKLIEVRVDTASAETGGMGGPYRFILRDHALHVLKLLTKCPVAETDCFEDTPDCRVFYKSWSPFLLWFEKQKR